jgi:hypothetical protein
MRIPKHLGAFDGRAEDFEWTRLEPLPVQPKPHAVQPPRLFMPELFHADVMEWSKKYAASLLSNPEWHKEQERKLAEKEERKRAREARIAERRQRRSKAA